MPPPGSRQPDQATHDGLVTWLEATLDRSTATPRPGRPVLHRLNRTEYANAIRDLLALDIGDVSVLLPPDDSAYGFDTISDFLGVSQALVERYMAAAWRISSLAIGDLESAPGSETYMNRQDLSQDKHLDDMPFGTVGGILARHTFPVDGEYVLKGTLFRTNTDFTRGLERPHEFEITVDGERVFVHTIGGTLPGEAPKSDQYDAELRVRVPVTAGPHTITAAFLQESRSPNPHRLQPFRSSFDTYNSTGQPHVETLVVVGPYNVTGVGKTPSRARVFVCRPASKAQELPCARRIVSTMARRAYRQAPTELDMTRVMEFYEAGAADGGFEAGIQRALQRILASPKFLLRVERDPEAAAPGEAYRITDVELATRLSFFLWSSIPDDELLDLGIRGRLRAPGVLDAQVRRMLADPKAGALVENFASQWLQLRNLQRVTPDNNLFPRFDDNLRQGLRREVELLFESVVHEDRSVLDLLTADYTFVDERVAKHYGIPNVYGSHFRRVPVVEERRGLLGKGAILVLTSNADRTSPVVRGKWILDNLLGMPPPSPPANVPPLEGADKEGKPRTMREQMETHRRNAVCASCHKLMDPIGLALEHFDAVGAWRTQDAGAPVDATTQLFDGTSVDGVVTLRAALLKHPEVYVGTLTEKLLTYALGRGVEAYDMPTIRAIGRDLARKNYRFSALVMGVVTSVPFQMRMKVDTSATTARK
jgi:hypothetical protein